MVELTGERTGLSTLNSLARTRGGLFDLVMATAFINLLGLAMPLTLLQVYDRIIPNDSQSTLLLLVAAVASALVLEGILRMARGHVGAWMGARFEHLVGCSAYGRFLESGLIDFERDGPGVHLERFNALGPLKEFYAGQIAQVLCDLPFALIFIAVIWFLAGPVALVPVVLILLFLFGAGVIGRQLRKALESRVVANDRRYSFIIEVLSGIHSVKGLAMEEQMLRRYERLQEASADAEFVVARHNAAAIGLGAVFSQLTLFATVSYGALFVIEGSLTIGGLAASTLLAGRAMQPLQRAVGIWTRFQSIRLSRQRMSELFDMEAEKPRGLPILPPCRGHIEMRNVSFGFGLNKDGVEQPPLFENVNLSIAAGDCIGVVGPNASGRSSLLYLMQGIYTPTEGQVLIDGHDVNSFDPSSVRQQIAYLPQNGLLFEGTILENLTMYRPEKIQDAYDSARLLNLDAVIAHLPQGYETIVGDGASDKLPRGFVQRIAIARALVDKPRVLLFDEANSAMDGAGDTALQKLLARLKGRVTMVMITPRPSILRMTNRVFEISDRRIEERRVQEGQVSQRQVSEGQAQKQKADAES